MRRPRQPRPSSTRPANHSKASTATMTTPIAAIVVVIACLTTDNGPRTTDAIAMRILVADKLADEGLEYLKSAGVAFDVKVGLKEEDLAAAIGGYEGLIV